MNLKLVAATALVTVLGPVVAGCQTLTVSVSGSGRVTGPGIDCGSDCSETMQPTKLAKAQVRRPNTVVLTASGPGMAAGGVNWGGACQAITGPVCTVTVPAAGAIVSALFATVNAPDVGGTMSDGLANLPSFEPSVIGPGTITKSVSGTVVTYRAEPNAGARFAGWAGVCTGSNPDCTHTPTGQFLTLKAKFGWPVTVHIEGPGGTVKGEGIDCPTVCTAVAVPPGLVLEATAVPTAFLKEWGGDCKTGTSTASGKTCSLSVTGPKTVTAKFEISLLTPAP